MACENPYRIRNPAYKKMQDELFWLEYYRETYGFIGLPDEFIEVPCGKCNSCRKDYVNAWRLRLRSEFERYPTNSVFITLTFEDKYLVKFANNPNKAVRLFLDRFRKRFNGKSCRHFIIGEYGEKTLRFHYHGILFNMPTGFDAEVLSNLWKYGFVYVGYCNEKTISYILKYITKPRTDKEKLLKIPRLIVSHGIGTKFVEDYANEPLKTELKPFITLANGGKMKLPRYVIEKMYDIEERIMMKIVNFDKPFERYLDGVKYTNKYEFETARKSKFLRNVGDGLSFFPDVKPVIKPLEPLRFDSVRTIDPFDKFDFYSPNEKRIKESIFELYECPF